MLMIRTTDLASKSFEILDNNDSRAGTFTVQADRTMVANISPPRKSMTATEALEGLKLPFMTRSQGEAWLRASKEGFDESVRDPWA